MEVTLKGMYIVLEWRAGMGAEQVSSLWRRRGTGVRVSEGDAGCGACDERYSTVPYVQHVCAQKGRTELAIAFAAKFWNIAICFTRFSSDACTLGPLTALMVTKRSLDSVHAQHMESALVWLAAPRCRLARHGANRF